MDEEDARVRVGEPREEGLREAAGLPHPLDAAEGLREMLGQGAQALAAGAGIEAVGSEEVECEQTGFWREGGLGWAVEGELAEEGGAVGAGAREAR